MKFDSLSLLFQIQKSVKGAPASEFKKRHEDCLTSNIVSENTITIAASKARQPRFVRLEKGY